MIQTESTPAFLLSESKIQHSVFSDIKGYFEVEVSFVQLVLYMH